MDMGAGRAVAQPGGLRITLRFRVGGNWRWMLCFQFIMLCYIAGPRLKGWLGGLEFIVDRVAVAAPVAAGTGCNATSRDHVRVAARYGSAGKKARHAFSRAEASNNFIFMRRARARRRKKISDGTGLTEAVGPRSMTAASFHWRPRQRDSRPAGDLSPRCVAGSKRSTRGPFNRRQAAAQDAHDGARALERLW